jgi:hypothetical protein
MLIVNDLGTEMVNLDLGFAIGIAPTPDGQYVLVVQGVSKWQTFLTVGTRERCEQALAAIRKGIKDRQNILDLLGLLGQRPEIVVPQPQIVLPGNGEGRH